MSRISNLEDTLKVASRKAVPPVESWNPPYCGDIGLAIGSDGRWWYRGGLIERQPLVALFASVLRRDDDGRHYLVTPAEKVDVAVADAPFLAVEMTAEGVGADQILTFRTNVDDVVAAGPAHPLRFVVDPATGGLKPYLRVRGRLDALVTRALVMDLVALAVERPGTGGPRLGLWSDGAWFEAGPA